MKVLLFDTTQSYLTPGGKQVHALKLYENLPKVGVEVDYAKWWEPGQSFDIIHFFGYNAPYLISDIRKKNKKVILTQIMDAQTNFSTLKKRMYGVGARIINRMPGRIRDKFYMSYLNNYDALVYMHKNDRDTAAQVFNVNTKNSFIIPHASDPVMINRTYKRNERLPSKYLVSVGSIVDRKRPVLLAQMARKAKIPVVFIGGNSNDSYFEEFRCLVDNEFVFYLGFISQEEKIEVMSNASGFVLLSNAESGCIAVYEAASLGLPLLLPNLMWAQSYDDPKEVYFCDCYNQKISLQQLQSFFQRTERKNFQSFRVHTWEDIAGMYKKVYESVI